MRKLIIATALSATLAGCASHPDSMTTTYTSGMAYQGYTCQQLANETQHLERRKSELYGQLEEERSADNAQMAVGMLLFWPALFFLEGGDGPQAAEYSRVKGELEAVQEQSNLSNCGYIAAQ